MSPRKHFSVASPGIATKAELEQRIAARPKPRAALHLTPTGQEAVELRQRLNEQSERRIKHLKERLETARQGLRKGQQTARLRGTAKRDFDRRR